MGHCERSHERAAIKRVGLPRIVDCFARAARSQGRGEIAPLLCVDWHSETALQIRKLIHTGQAKSAGQILVFVPPSMGAC